ERGVRADDEDATPLQVPAVGVEQVSGAVQRGDRLAGAGATLDDEDAAQFGADDAVLLLLDGGHHVGHPAGAFAAHGGDEGGLAGERVPVVLAEAVEVGDLVIDAGTRSLPRVDVAPADQAAGLARGRGVEGARGGRAPVDQLEFVIVVAQADAADIQRCLLFVIGPAEAQAAFGVIELREAPFVFGGGDVPLQPGLVGAAWAALPSDVG